MAETSSATGPAPKMGESKTASPTKAADTGPAKLPRVYIVKPHKKIDFATIIGLFSSIAMIGIAIAIGQSNANFFNLPSFLIVILGTVFATTISFSGSEIAKAGDIIIKSTSRRIQDPKLLAESLLHLSIIAKKKGILALAAYDDQTKKDPFLGDSIQLVVDGYEPEAIDYILKQRIEAQKDRHRRSANITRRAAEIAPAMGLIGTLVGLVQMLAELENPETIGPAMAVALLTTFYGAILGTIIMAPLAVKLEKNSNDETLVKTLIMTAALSISRQENPRRLEMLLNAELPPHQQIRYFD